jgi:hypothetical protein
MGRAASGDAAGGQVSQALKLDGLVCRYGCTCWVVRMIDADIAGRPVPRSAGS